MERRNYKKKTLLPRLIDGKNSNIINKKEDMKTKEIKGKGEERKK